jgi:hypothetical protein
MSTHLSVPNLRVRLTALAATWEREAMILSAEDDEIRASVYQRHAGELAALLREPPEAPLFDALHAEALAALRGWKKIPRPWIDAVIRERVQAGRIARPAGTLTVDEWDAACAAIEQAIAKLDAARAAVPEER